jgi:hypothetical protein
MFDRCTAGNTSSRAPEMAAALVPLWLAQVTVSYCPAMNSVGGRREVRVL